MTDFETVDYFTDMLSFPDPYPYFDHLRSKCPVSASDAVRRAGGDGHQEALAVYKDPAFSSCVAVAGPFPRCRSRREGDDISASDRRAPRGDADGRAHRHEDAEAHPKTRGLLSRLITPKRLSENEDFMWRLVDQQLDKFIDRGACEFIADYAKPLSMLVDRRPARACRSRTTTNSGPRFGQRDRRRIWARRRNRCAQPAVVARREVPQLHQDRRREPRDDVLTELAAATKPRTGRPGDRRSREAWRRSSSRRARRRRPSCVSTAMRVIGGATRHPDRRCATTARKIPAFLEESLRMESPVKSALPDGADHDDDRRCGGACGHHRHAVPGASNRDRAQVRRSHTSSASTGPTCVSSGVHAWARTRAPARRWPGPRRRISMNRILDRMAEHQDLRREMHGPAGDRKLRVRTRRSSCGG